jgi:bifunctional non-homologous end joining protein LigD
MAARKRLREYAKKRDFARTAEPSGKKAAKPRAKKKAAKRPRKTAAKAAAKRPSRRAAATRRSPIFVVQHHRASHDHHDFRLEHDGVLLSWAVPKHVSRTVGVRRLAVQVEDHPLEYATFTGTIPKGNYGAGTVERYDIGTWEPDFDVDYGLEKGHLAFTLHGDKLKGRWDLVRMAPRDGEEGKKPSKPQWLLVRRSASPAA